MSDHIEECMFCGSDNTECRFAEDVYYVHCKYCGASGPRKPDAEYAVSLWNAVPKLKRPSIENEECPFCNKKGDLKFTTYPKKGKYYQKIECYNCGVSSKEVRDIIITPEEAAYKEWIKLTQGYKDE